MKFEYCVVGIEHDREIEVLDKWGEHGWELVAVYEGFYYLKRKIDSFQIALEAYEKRMKELG